MVTIILYLYNQPLHRATCGRPRTRPEGAEYQRIFSLSLYIMKKTKKNIGGVKIFTTTGKFINEPSILYNGQNFFRKMTTNINEIELCKLLMKNPHKNIIKIYDIGTDYVDMELLNISMHGVDMSEIIKIFTEVKEYLQNLGIIYIDWKLDNIGISYDRNQ
jgi:hypothetical protein